LKTLENNFVQSKADAEGYFKDKEKLKEALEVVDYRRKTVVNLLNELK
jgi:hypothetical protein